VDSGAGAAGAAACLPGCSGSGGVGVAIGTARNQLKQIFLKTDVRRQSELVRLLTADLAAQAAQLVGA